MAVLIDKLLYDALKETQRVRAFRHRPQAR